MTPEELARACAAAMWENDHATRGLGITLDHVAPHTARLGMVVQPTMVNGHGMCHGGFLFTLADSAFAFACNSANQRAVAAQCSVFFLAPARLGDHLVATAARRSEAGRSGIYDVTVATDTGTLIAEFRGQSRTIGQTFFPDLP